MSTISPSGQWLHEGTMESLWSLLDPALSQGLASNTAGGKQDKKTGGTLPVWGRGLGDCAAVTRVRSWEEEAVVGCQEASGAMSGLEGCGAGTGEVAQGDRQEFPVRSAGQQRRQQPAWANGPGTARVLLPSCQAPRGRGQAWRKHSLSFLSSLLQGWGQCVELK